MFFAEFFSFLFDNTSVCYLVFDFEFFGFVFNFIFFGFVFDFDLVEGKKKTLKNFKLKKKPIAAFQKCSCRRL